VTRRRTPPPAPPGRWLTIPQACASLQITRQQRERWRLHAITPLHLVSVRGQLLVRADDLTRRLDSQPAPSRGNQDDGQDHDENARGAS
jgi:hypothetical protein